MAYILCGVAGLVSQTGGHHHQADRPEEEHLGVRHLLHLEKFINECHKDFKS